MERRFTLTLKSTRPPGRQYAGMDKGIICVSHESGIYIEVPCNLFRSQFYARQAALEALEYLTGEKCE